jgi:3-dehydroquinate synthase
MHELQVSLAERSYSILVGHGVLAHCAPLIRLAQGRMVAVVSDTNVAPLYGGLLRETLEGVAAQLVDVVLPAGEAYKTWASVNQIVDALLTARCDRQALIVALGGGVVGDMAGFAAAVYQRGIDFVQIPTTLLAQVDSSVGGKTGINHPLGKNMIGAFHQPRLVVIDVDTLKTLPERERSAGLAEVIKHGAIADPGYLTQIEQEMPALRAGDSAILAKVVARSCAIKADLVARDEREGGVRAWLNFGHTFGHAIEAGMGYGSWLHGEAVGAGMVMAATLSAHLGLLSQDEAKRLEALIAAAGLPVRGPAWPAARYLELMSVDKKARQGAPQFVVLEALGRASLRGAAPEHLAQVLAVCTEA